MQDTSVVLDFEDVSNHEPAPLHDLAGFKNTKRALRRHHLERLKAVRSRHMLVQGSMGIPPSAKRIGVHAHTAANCSCAMCGNPRKHFGERTRQELRLMQRIRPWATNK